ncbi:MAG: hypothetical protein ABJG15_17065 [Hyphomonadaceae bacterium]
MRFFSFIIAAGMVSGCSSWSTLNTDDMLQDARDRSVLTSRAHALANWQEETFGGLAAFPGRTFRGEPMTAQGTPDTNGVADVQSWAWSEDGKEIVIHHALEDGSYGGRSLVYPKASGDELAYSYVTSAGFETLGTFTLYEDGSWESIETVEGHPTITHVRSRGYERADGALISESDYLTGNEWSRGTSFVYTEFDGDVPEVLTGSAE